MTKKKIYFPLTNKEILSSLEAGEMLELNGIIYTARDQAHYRMIKLIEEGKKLPFELTNNAIYYCGPTPKREDNLFGSAGPTTSSRMDKAFVILSSLGLSASIGKGNRSAEVVEACKKYKSLYFITFGGAGAYLAKKILKQELIAFEELGPEAIYRLEVKDFPVIVSIDTKGKNILY